jgi:hypothetical protein
MPFPLLARMFHTFCGTDYAVQHAGARIRGFARVSGYPRLCSRYTTNAANSHFIL